MTIRCTLTAESPSIVNTSYYLRVTRMHTYFFGSRVPLIEWTYPMKQAATPLEGRRASVQVTPAVAPPPQWEV